MLISKKLGLTVHSVPFMGMDEDLEGVIKGAAVQIFFMSKHRAESPKHIGWELFMTPQENLDLISRSLEMG